MLAVPEGTASLGALLQQPPGLPAAVVFRPKDKTSGEARLSPWAQGLPQLLCPQRQHGWHFLQGWPWRARLGHSKGCGPSRRRKCEDTLPLPLPLPVPAGTLMTPGSCEAPPLLTGTMARILTGGRREAERPRQPAEVQAAPTGVCSGLGSPECPGTMRRLPEGPHRTRQGLWLVVG